MKKAIVLVLLVVFSTKAFCTLTIYTYEIPGMVYALGREATGPGIPLIQMPLQQLGVETDIRVQPFARAHKSAKQDPNSCVFPYNWMRSRSADLHYLLVLSEVPHRLYSLENKSWRLHELQDKTVVALEQYSHQDKLNDYKLSTLLVTDPNAMFRLLQSNRIDFIYTNEGIAHSIQVKHQVQLHPAATLHISTTWLACHPSAKLPSKSALTEAFYQLMSSGQMRQIWDSYQQSQAFDHFFGAKGEKWQQLNDKINKQGPY